ncbi:MAG: hypothetical protein U0838_13085 [Chloroflexota bacterium]
MTAAERVRGWSGRGEYPTLGWDVLEQMSALPSPADPAEPLVLTDEQALQVLQFYRLDPVTGDFPNRRARSEMAKGWGKSPELAGISIIEFAGRCRFGGWGDDGEPIAVPVHWPVVEVAAVSEDQTDNTWAVVLWMLGANESRAARELGIDVGRTRCYLTGGRPGTMRPVTAESRSREGARLTFAVLDETQLWLKSNGGTALAATIRRNAAKMDGRTWETCNAPVVGQGSVAEEAGTDPVPGVLHFARRARELPERDWPVERLRAELVHVYGDSWWAPIDRILAEIADPANDWDDILRFYFNLRSAAKSAAADPDAWDRQGPPAVPVRDVPAGSRVALGFDGSLSLDSTVLRACTPDGYRFSQPGWSWVRPRGDEMRAWALEHPGEDWRVPRAEVEQAVAEAFARFDVGLMRPDAAFWRDEITRWQRLYGDDVVVPFDTNSARQMGPAFDRWSTAVANGTAPHDGDPVVTAHVKAMRKAPARGGQRDDDGRTIYVPVKGEDRAKIDGGLADILAYTAAMTMPEAAPEEPSVYETRGVLYV